MNDFEVMKVLSDLDGPKAIRMSPHFVSAVKVKQGGHVTMGVDETVIYDLVAGGYTCALYIIEQKRFFELKKLPPRRDIILLEAERFAWSKEVFTRATAESSLDKLKDEIREVREELSKPNDVPMAHLAEEYADCLMCLFDSAGRAGVTPEEIFTAFEAKLKKNKARDWKENDNNTYSHIK